MHSLTLLSLFILATTCSSLFFGGAGGGGGCGCMSSCGGGCGGRKKRSADPPPFVNLASNDEDMLCNSPELKKIILDSMKETSDESGRSVSAVLEQHGDRFVVVCSENRFAYFINPNTEFCGARKGNHYCQAFAI